MSIALDGFEVLRRIAEHPDLFAPVRADVDKQSRALVIKCLKAKSLGLDALHAIYGALGQQSFELLLDGLKDAEVKTLVSRFDKHHPDAKAGSASWRRQHLKALADRSSLPQPAPAKGKKASAKKTKQEPSRLQSETISVYREGGKKGE